MRKSRIVPTVAAFTIVAALVGVAQAQKGKRVTLGQEWMVGTYGAGVLGLDRSGHFHSFEGATGQIEINPDAMLVTKDHVFAGTLGKGLYVYERESERWFPIEAGLPSSNVTALASANGYLYVGTDNGLVRVPEQKLHP